MYLNNSKRMSTDNNCALLHLSLPLWGTASRHRGQRRTRGGSPVYRQHHQHWRWSVQPGDSWTRRLAIRSICSPFCRLGGPAINILSGHEGTFAVSRVPLQSQPETTVAHVSNSSNERSNCQNPVISSLDSHLPKTLKVHLFFLLYRL